MTRNEANLIKKAARMLFEISGNISSIKEFEERVRETVSCFEEYIDFIERTGTGNSNRGGLLIYGTKNSDSR